jgi:hypothetical protein
MVLLCTETLHPGIRLWDTEQSDACVVFINAFATECVDRDGLHGNFPHPPLFFSIDSNSQMTFPMGSC